MHPFWRWFWRLFALVMMVGVGVGAYVLWRLWRAQKLTPAVQGQQVPDGFDVVAYQLDLLTLTVTLMGIALAVASIFGYQGVKAAAEEMANKTATRRADEVATQAVAEHIEKLGRSFPASSQQPTTPSVDPGNVEEITGG
jgi:hypothetical protein